MTTTDDAKLTRLRYTPVMVEINEAIADLNVQFVGIFGGEMRFNRIARAAAEGEADAAEVSRGRKLLDRIVARICENPKLVEQITDVDSVSLRD